MVTIVINNPVDLYNPAVSSAELHCPSTWSDYITDSMVVAANNKGWNMFVGGTAKTVETT